jgi:hypothetical protein
LSLVAVAAFAVTLDRRAERILARDDDVRFEEPQSALRSAYVS